MDTLEPLINIITLLTAFSIAAERITNLLKLRDPALRAHKSSPNSEKAREEEITRRSVGVSIALAVVLKIDLISVIQNADAPWDVIGWYSMQGTLWIPAPEVGNAPAMIAAFIGCIAGGLALGFGSKFWHEMLDTVLELRGIAKAKRVKRENEEEETDSPEAELGARDPRSGAPTR